MLITNNDIITIVGPTAKQPQLEILHSSGSGTKDFGTLTETNAMAEKRQKHRDHPATRYELTNGEDDDHSYNYLLRTYYVLSTVLDPERKGFIY